MRRMVVTLCIVGLAGCGRQPSPRPQQLHAAPFQYLSDVRLGMSETDLVRARRVQPVGAGQYREEVATYAVLYIFADGRLAAVIVPESYANATAAGISFRQHAATAYRGLDVAARCRVDAGERRRMMLYQLKGEVYEIALKTAAGDSASHITRSFLLAPSLQWRGGQEQACAQ